MAVSGGIVFTRREEQVGAMVAAGLEIAEIAQALGVRPTTASTYVARLALKIPGTLTPMKKIMRYWLLQRTGGSTGNASLSRPVNPDMR